MPYRSGCVFRQQRLDWAGTYTMGVYSYSASAAALTLFYPRLVTSDGVNGNPDTSEYTGIAAANLGATDASLTFTAYDIQGRLISGAGITNPATLPLPKGAQLPIVDTQVWGSGLPAAKPVGWFTMDSTSPKVVGFFLVYNSTLAVLDGADVSAAKTDTFIFPEVEPNGFTQIHVANPNTAAASVTFDLKTSDGSTKRTAARTLQPYGSVSERLSDMFSGEALDGTEYVSVRGNGGLVPFEYLGRIPYRVQGLNGQGAMAGATTLYSPQYAVGGSTWATSISVVNLEAVPGTVTFRLIGDNGAPIGISRSLAIAAGGKIRVTDQEFFVKAGSTLAQGYVEIKSSGPRLGGSVVFGDQAGTAFSAALPLVGALQSDVVFSQVASNSTWYTGLALLNPGSIGASATIQIYDRTGQLLRSKVEAIEASGRKSMLLTQYFPDLYGAEISSGYIRVVSDKPLATFALFGAANVLSAVPPQIVP
jgi:hypothetical protein